MEYQTKKTYPRRYHPMLVSNDGTDEKMDGQTSFKLWGFFDLLPEETRRVVAADEVAEKMKKLQDTFHIDDSVIGKMTLLIRRLFFGEVNIVRMEIEIGNVLAQFSPEKINQVKDIVQFIQNEILTIKPKPRKENNENEKEKQAKIDKISLEKALLKYPNLGEQTVTGNPLKLRYFPTPVKPSIKNWITDYHDSLGAGKHSTIDRGNYLFHSENGKRLTPLERQKISLLLKSLDEEALLDVDGEAQKIIFNIAGQEAVVANKDVVTSSTAPAMIDRMARPTVVSNDLSPADSAQARIRKSLDFSNLQAAQVAKKENTSKIFEFEDEAYADSLREKNGSGAKPDLGGSVTKNEFENDKPKFGSLSFSSAQKLPVEKKSESFGRDMTFQDQKRTTGQEKSANDWNPQDFKSQISQANPTFSKRQGSLRGNIGEERRPMETRREYSPYVITPSGYQAKDDSGGMIKNNPRIQGNTVDLS